VTADFEVNGMKAGVNIGPKFKSIAEGIWELRLTNPPSLPHAKLQVEVRDRQGNTTRIERVFSVKSGIRSP
jgi:hypothetical protein